MAIKNACYAINNFQLTGCQIYASCEPCPMCLAAIYWARIGKIYFANTKKMAAGIGFIDSFIYRELRRSLKKRSLPTVRLKLPEAKFAFEEWVRKKDKIRY